MLSAAIKADQQEEASSSVLTWFLYVLQPPCVVSSAIGSHHTVLVGKGLYCLGVGLRAFHGEELMEGNPQLVLRPGSLAVT